MLKFKFEVQSICDKCGHKGYDFKLYEVIEELQDGTYEKTNKEVCICPKCGYKE